MKTLKQLIFTLAVVIGLSIAVSAQKDDQKKPPPKGQPPVVTPGNKKPPKENPPKGGDKPKKPGYAIEISGKVEAFETFL